MKKDLMEIKIVDIIKENIHKIPVPCRECVYWEAPQEFEKLKTLDTKEVSLIATQRKQKWFITTLKTFGSCGKIVFANDKQIGYAQYAPSNLLPQVQSYQSKRIGKIEDGTVFLSCLYINEKQFRGKGIGKLLLENIMTELKNRGFKAIETFARKETSNNPSGPLEFYSKKGFKQKETINSEYILVRLEFQ
jgi:ribosomal protein S18 acetylase RimI-like enzyme